MNKQELHPEGGRGYKELKQKKTLAEILQTAMRFEEIARDFYSQLCSRVSKPLRGLVQELAEEETNHYQLFKELIDRDDIQPFITDKIATPPNDHQFSDFIQIPNLGEQPTDQEVLLFALGREQAAMEQYAALAQQTPPGPIADPFQYLANEELEHKKELEKVYYEIVHSGGV